MKSEILSKYLKKVKLFAKENAPYEQAKSVFINGTEDSLTLTCCDGSSGIVQQVPIFGSPIIGECAINVFDFAKIVDKISGNTELKFNIGNKLSVKQDTFKFELPITTTESMFHIPEPETWINTNKEFYKNLEIVIPDAEVEDRDYPIVNDSTQLYYANPRRIIVLEADTSTPEFLIDKLHAKRIFTDTFTQMALHNNLVYFKNDKCEIFLPTFSSSKKLKLDPVINTYKANHVYPCILDGNELSYIYDLIRCLSEFSIGYQHRINLEVTTNSARILFYDAEFVLEKVQYNGPPCSIMVPLVNLHVITRPSFIGDNPTCKLMLADFNTMFAICKSNVLFIGGLFKE